MQSLAGTKPASNGSILNGSHQVLHIHVFLVAPPSTSHTKYFEQVLYPESNANCKDINAKRTYAEALQVDKAKELYDKMRNRY